MGGELISIGNPEKGSSRVRALESNSHSPPLRVARTGEKKTARKRKKGVPP